MNRTLTAAVALAAGLGMAGLAHAQTTSNPAMSQTPGAASATPGMTTQTPSALQNPASMTTPGAYGTQSPQASSSTNEPGSMNQNGGQPSQALIQQAQQQLKSQGLYRGEVDGINGPATEKAVSQFQKQQGLPETAQLDQQTLGRLMGNSDAGGTQNTASPGSAGAQNPASTMPGNR